VLDLRQKQASARPRALFDARRHHASQHRSGRRSTRSEQCRDPFCAGRRFRVRAGRSSSMYSRSANLSPASSAPATASADDGHAGRRQPGATGRQLNRGFAVAGQTARFEMMTPACIQLMAMPCARWPIAVSFSFARPLLGLDQRSIQPLELCGTVQLIRVRVSCATLAAACSAVQRQARIRFSPYSPGAREAALSRPGTRPPDQRRCQK